MFACNPQTRPRRVLIGLALAALAIPVIALAAPVPTTAEKELATSISTGPSTADAADAHRDAWSPGLVAALIAEGTAGESKDLAHSESLYRLSQDIASEIGDAETEALALSSLGALLTRREAFPEGIALLRKAVAMQTGDGHDVGGHVDTDHVSDACRSVISLALGLVNTGQIEEAVTVSAQAADLATASGDELMMGRAWSVSGSAAIFSGNHRAAIAFLQKALAIAEKHKSLGGQAAVLNNLGLANRQVFDFDAAAGYYERSLEIKRQQGPTARLASTLENLGELALVQDHLDEAEKYFRLTLDAAHSPQEDDVKAGVFINLGLVAQSRGDFTKALDDLNQGIVMAEKLGDASSLVLARLFLAAVDLQLHRPDDAQGQVDKGRDLAKEAGDQRVNMRLTMAQGDIYRDQGQTQKARTEYLSAIQQFETLRLNVAGDESTQSAYADNTRYVYTGLIGLDASSGQMADAFHYSELSKSRVLLDDLISGRAEMTRLLTPAEARRNTEFLALMSDLNTRLRSAAGAERKSVVQQLDKLRFDYSSFRAGVYVAHPELALRRADPEPVSLTRAAALLPDEHTAMVSYSVGESAAYALVITRVAGKPVLHVRELKTDLDRLTVRVRKWREQIAARELGFNALATELYDTLVKPVQSDLAGGPMKIDRLIISPDGPLWQVPFEALQNSAGKFMAENYEIFYVPSVTVLDKMRSVSAKRIGHLSMLALGDPTGDLPEAVTEVNSIGKLYAAGSSKVLTGPAATEAALRADAGHYSVIHIAAHGLYDDARPLYSFLALAPSPAISKTTAGDGNLEAREIMDLHLNAKLVILSGCETARSSGSGMGIAGMSWALFIAGAPATIASLWKVDSQSTSVLMTELHRGLAQGETTARALRDAKLTLLRNPAYRHPFYWAGFIGIGAGN